LHTGYNRISCMQSTDPSALLGCAAKQPSTFRKVKEFF